MTWHTEVRKISELKNWENNPRTISEESYKTLKKSIGDLGNFEPLVINIDGTVLAGNQRLRVHKEQGDTEVEVSVPERELTEEEIKKIGIISNRHSGEWDMDKLANEFEDVLEELGFDDLLPEVELDVEEDDYEEPEDLEVKVKLGEVWQLGKHRLMCGDSTKIEDVEKLMNGQKADMVFTDPPYNADYKSRGKDKKLADGIKNDAMSDSAFEDFIGDFLPNLVLASKDGSSYYICCNWKDSYPRFYFACQNNGITVSSNIVWNKGSGGMGWQDYRYQYEFIIYGFTKGHQWYGGRTETDIWDFNRDGRQTYVHPTQKPVSLSSRAINNSSKQGDSILDLFGGSGSTLIACEQTNRVCYMMELDEHYATVILDRWEKLTGEQGVKLED